MSQNTLRRLCRGCCAGLLSAVLLTGCAPALMADDAASDRTLITPWQTLAGARLHAQPAPAFGIFPNAGVVGYLAFLSPTMVAVRNNLIYVADAGHRQLFRYDPAQMVMNRFADQVPASVSGLVVAPDMSLYVVDTGARRVLHFSQDGRLLRTFSNEHALARPVAMVLDDASGQTLVADSLYNHVVVFNSLGRALGTLRSLEARSIESMARGPDGLYLVDGLSRQVVVMGLDGSDRYSIGEGTLKDPRAIVVDRYNRVFVSDDFDNTLKVYERGQLAATYGGVGSSPIKFNRITSLALDHNTLYVADSLNNRIQIFHVAPPSVPKAEMAR